MKKLFLGLLPVVWGYLEGRQWVLRKPRAPISAVRMPSPAPHSPLQKMIVVAQVQGGGFCKWRMPKPPFQEVDLSMGGGRGGVARMRPVTG